MDEDIADFSVKYAQKLGAEYVEVRLESTLTNGFLLKNGNLETTGFDKYEGLGLRFLYKNKLGFISTNELNKTKIMQLLEKSIRTTNNNKIAEKISLSSEKTYNKKYEVKQKIKLEDIDITEKINFLKESEKAIKDSKVNVPSRILVYNDNDTTEYLTTSEGTKITARVPKINFFYILSIEENNRLLQRNWTFGKSGGWEQIKNFNIYNKFKTEVTSLSNVLKKGIKTPQGNFPIICGPEVVGIMVHESCGHPMEADRILGREAAQAGESFITKNSLGKKIGTEQVTIVDDSTIENSYGFLLYDNEGVKCQKKYLYKKGKINEFLHNRETAASLNLKNNGSSRACDYDKESIVRMSNTFMLPGKFKEEELFESVKLGVYMKNFTQWNIDDKRLNQKYTGAEAYLIENGEITKPVINPIIEVSSKRLYHAVDAVANNFELHAGNCGKGEPQQGIPVTFGGPSIRLKGLRIK